MTTTFTKVDGFVLKVVFVHAFFCVSLLFLLFRLPRLVLLWWDVFNVRYVCLYSWSETTFKKVKRNTTSSFAVIWVTCLPKVDVKRKTANFNFHLFCLSFFYKARLDNDSFSELHSAQVWIKTIEFLMMAKLLMNDFSLFVVPHRNFLLLYCKSHLMIFNNLANCASANYLKSINFNWKTIFICNYIYIFLYMHLLKGCMPCRRLHHAVKHIDS